MSKEEVQANVNAVVELFLEKNKNLAEESSKYWVVITNQTYKFKQYQMIAEVLKTKMTVDTVLAFFDKYIAKGSPNRKKLSVQVFSSNHISRMDEPVLSDGEVEIITYEGISAFRSKMELYPATPDVEIAAFMPNFGNR